MELNLEQLKKKRGVAKAAITRFINNVNITESSSISQLRIWKEELEKKVGKYDLIFDAIKDVIIGTLASEEAEMAIQAAEQAADIEERLTQDLKLRLQEAIDAKESVLNSTLDDNEGQRIASSIRTQIKLPEIPCPQFSGNYYEYPAWRDLFSANIDSADIDEVAKMQHLVRSLEGLALSAIKGFPPTKESYAMSLKVLDETFGNPRKCIKEIITELMTMPVPPRGKALETIFAMEGMVRTLKSQIYVERKDDEDEIQMELLDIILFQF